MKISKKDTITSCLAVFLSAALIAGCKPIFEKKPLPPGEGKDKAAAAAPAPAPAPAPAAAAAPAEIENVASLEPAAVNEEGGEETELTPPDDGGDIVKPNPTIIRNIQQALIDAGFNPGVADGKSGAKTVAALEAFQKQNGIPAGNIDKRTLRALGVAF